MDNESSELLRQLCDLQREQTDLLRKHLLRLRFSVRALLILMTLVAIALGMVGWQLTKLRNEPAWTSFPPGGAGVFFQGETETSEQ